MSKRITWFLALSVLLFSQASFAKTVAGIEIPNSVTLDNGETLTLNGAGIRSKFFFKIYAAGLYLPTSMSNPEQIYSLAGGKRILMHFIYDGVSREKLVDAWNEGFKNNLTSNQLTAISKEIEAFNRVFVEAKKNDQIALDFIPDTGTKVWINNSLKVTIPGATFYTALLKIWLGQEPADSGLKKALLGR